MSLRKEFLKIIKKVLDIHYIMVYTPFNINEKRKGLNMSAISAERKEMIISQIKGWLPYGVQPAAVVRDWGVPGLYHDYVIVLEYAATNHEPFLEQCGVESPEKIMAKYNRFIDKQTGKIFGERIYNNERE
jgi:hypothetical protein